MKLVILLVGALVVLLAVILDNVNERNDWLAAGLILFSLTASTYFLAWPVSRDDQRNWRFNTKSVWLFIYLMVAAVCAMWLWLLKT
ncbi:MAG: hypothetical protein IH937_13205 [Acidobacteria bacterium]|nr:hypothetical protein [Acidobacteriota bacterium]